MEKFTERAVNVIQYTILIGIFFALIIYDAFAIDQDNNRYTFAVLLNNLIFLVHAYNQLFMRPKSESTKFEKVLLTMNLLLTIIGSMIVVANTSILK